MSDDYEIGRCRCSSAKLASWLEQLADASPELADGDNERGPLVFLEGSVHVTFSTLMEVLAAGSEGTDAEGLTDRSRGASAASGPDQERDERPLRARLETARILRVFTPAWEVYGRAVVPSRPDDPADSGGDRWRLRTVAPKEALSSLSDLLDGRQEKDGTDGSVWAAREPVDSLFDEDDRVLRTVLLAGQYSEDEGRWWEGEYGRFLSYPTDAIRREQDAPESDSPGPPRRVSLEMAGHRHRGMRFWRWRRIVAGTGSTEG